MPIYGSKFQNLGGQKNSTKIWKMEPLDSKPHQSPPGCLPLKMVPPYSLGTYPPTTPSHFDTLSLLHQENIDFLKSPDFGQSTRTALESPKNWHTSKLTKRGPRRCLKLSWDQIWQKFQWKVSKLPKRNCRAWSYKVV